MATTMITGSVTCFMTNNSNTNYKLLSTVCISKCYDVRGQLFCAGVTVTVSPLQSIVSISYSLMFIVHVVCIHKFWSPSYELNGG